MADNDVNSHCVYCMGEALIDMYGDEACVGGAPANTAACIAKLGGKSAFIGGISDDAYGKRIFDELNSLGVDMTYVKRVLGKPTAIAHTLISPNGERSFSFDRDGTADLSLDERDVLAIPFKAGDVLHFCSNCLMDEGMYRAHMTAIARAKEASAIISYDVNLRPSLWDDEGEMLKRATSLLPYANIIKVSEEEERALCGKDEVASDGYVSKGLKAKCPAADIIIKSEGASGGCFEATVWSKLKGSDKLQTLFSKRGARYPAYNDSPLDTDGAGDCLIGATLYNVAKEDALDSFEGMLYAINFAAVAAAISVSKRGAIPSYPTLDEVMNSPYIKKI